MTIYNQIYNLRHKTQVHNHSTVARECMSCPKLAGLDYHHYNPSRNQKIIKIYNNAQLQSYRFEFGNRVPKP